MRNHGHAEDEAGASAVEYGLLISGIAAIIVLAVFAFGGGVSTLFSSTCTTVTSAVNNAGAQTAKGC